MSTEYMNQKRLEEATSDLRCRIDDLTYDLDQREVSLTRKKYKNSADLGNITLSIVLDELNTAPGSIAPSNKREKNASDRMHRMNKLKLLGLIYEKLDIRSEDLNEYEDELNKESKDIIRLKFILREYKGDLEREYSANDEVIVSWAKERVGLGTV